MLVTINITIAEIIFIRDIDSYSTSDNLLIKDPYWLLRSTSWYLTNTVKGLTFEGKLVLAKENTNCVLQRRKENTVNSVSSSCSKCQPFPVSLSKIKPSISSVLLPFFCFLWTGEYGSSAKQRTDLDRWGWGNLFST